MEVTILCNHLFIIERVMKKEFISSRTVFSNMGPISHWGDFNDFWVLVFFFQNSLGNFEIRLIGGLADFWGHGTN